MPDPERDEKVADVVVVVAEDGAAPAAAAENPAVVTPDEGIAKLQRELAAEREARVAAETRANESAAREAAARGETMDSQLAQITGALDTVTANAETLKANYAAAAAAGDWEQVAEIQTQIARNENHRVQLEQGKASLEAAPKPKAAVAPVRPADPVEALAKQLTPRSADWVRAHPEFTSDPKKYAQMVAAHNLTVSRDFKPDSDEYFAEVEKVLGVGAAVAKAPVDGELPGEKPLTAAAEATGGRGAQPPAAPVTRSGTGTGSRPTVVRLTSAEREAAKASGLTDEEYARNKMDLQKQGRLN
jgi:hypothetical protein